MQQDPYEDKNSYNNSQYVPIISQLKKELLQLRTQYKDTDEASPKMKTIMER